MNTRRKRQSPCDLPVIASCELFVSGLLNGTATVGEFKKMEKLLGKTDILAWFRHRTVETRSGVDSDPEYQKVIADATWSEELEQKAVEKGLLGIILEQEGERRRDGMASIAALFLSPDRLERFIELIYRRGLPQWCRRDGVNDLAIRNKPVTTANDNGLASTCPTDHGEDGLLEDFTKTVDRLSVKSHAQETT